MTIGAYRAVEQFAYPGWRLTVPGGPAGGHYKGFTHTQATGTTLLPQDEYEQDRGDGMSSHDAVHATQRNPRGVYRSSAEVPPRPNASGSAHRVRSFQTQRHPGQAVAPGSFPAPFDETDEDAFVHRYDPHGLGVAVMPISDIPLASDGPGFMLNRQLRVPVDSVGPVYSRPPIVMAPPQQTLPAQGTVCTEPSPPPAGQHWEISGVDSFGCTFYHLVPDAVAAPPSTGATSVVNQPPALPHPLPPSPAIPVYTAPPASPAPAPVVNTNQVVPLNDGSGNYVNTSTGAIVPASAVAQNPATGQLTASLSSAASSALAWFEENSIFSAVPNWVVVGGGLLLAKMFLGGGSAARRR